MTITTLHQHFLAHPDICTDTRKITPNCLFFALRGDNFDGNTYAQEALEQGAAFAIVDRPELADIPRMIYVADVLTCLQDLARHHRQACKAQVIAITGSNGKTTTKELITAVLSKKYRTIATRGNLNNHIGLPLTLLSIKSDTEMAVVEMGANHPGEIKFLCGIALPDYGYITNFGKAHLEGFGSVEGVIKAKGELYDHLLASHKLVFFNADDPIQHQKLTAADHKFGFGEQTGYDLPIHFLGADPFVHLEAQATRINTHLVGRYNFTNCGAALAIGSYFKVKIADIKEAIENYIPQNNRSQILKKNGLEIILDAYNANPTSMKAALENFRDLKADYKVIFLGDMFELGASAEAEHQEIADLVQQLGADRAYLIGSNFFKTHGPVRKCETFEKLAETLRTEPIDRGTVLIKGSRGMALERILDLL